MLNCREERVLLDQLNLLRVEVGMLHASHTRTVTRHSLSKEMYIVDHM
jgi:hypothetical protein